LHYELQLHLSQIIILGSRLISLSNKANTKRYEIQTIHRKHNTKLYGGINIGRQSKYSNNKKDKNIEPVTKL
jgi:hypothetical protein